METKTLAPTSEKQRFIILDALRGLALLMIILANFPEFGLWSFLGVEARQAMPGAEIDNVLRFFQYFLIDGKGYTIFSLLFGCGFAIILEHSFRSGKNGVLLFFRRMFLLLLIALCHLMFIWSGDILCLYAVAGMLLPLFRRLSNRNLLITAAILLFIPVALDFWQQMAGVDIAAPLEGAWWASAGSYGINEDNFATWLRDAETYPAVFDFLKQGAIERMWEFVAGDRLFKVLGLFIIGYTIGRNKLYEKLGSYKKQIQKMLYICASVALPLSLIYAWHSVNGQRFGEAMQTLLYFLSVVPMALFYLSAICLFYIGSPESKLFRIFAKPGRMALSNYIGQSVIGVIIYYGIGFGLGLSQGLAAIEITALAVFCFQILASAVWMKCFRFGPLEWIWRMLTYGRLLNPIKA